MTGHFPDVSSGVPNIDNVGNPFGVYASSFGLFGIDNLTSGATTNQSVFVAFSKATVSPAGQSFNTFGTRKLRRESVRFHLTLIG